MAGFRYNKVHANRKGRAMGSPIRGVWCLLSLLGPEFASVPVQGEDLSGATSGLQSAFLENRGQWPERVRFAARRHGWTAAVEGDALSFTCAVGGEGAAAERVSNRLRFEGASPLARAEGLG